MEFYHVVWIPICEKKILSECFIYKMNTSKLIKMHNDCPFFSEFKYMHAYLTNTLRAIPQLLYLVRFLFLTAMCLAPLYTASALLLEEECQWNLLH